MVNRLILENKGITNLTNGLVYMSEKPKEIEPYPLYTCEDMMEWPPAKWLIKDILPENGCGVLYGKPADGKSFIALDWAMSVALGNSWLEKFDTISGGVLYI